MKKLNQFMTRLLISSMALAGLMTCLSCIFYRQPPQEKLLFLTEVRNIESVNSIYDDMNLMDWGANATGTLYFSSNRNSKGKDFDIVPASFSYYRKGDFRKEEWNADNPTDVPANEKEAFSQINTEFSEIGPCVFPPAWIYSKDDLALAEKQNRRYWFYANNSAGNFDIKFIYCDLPINTVAKKQWRKGIADLINSPADDCYPTFDIHNTYIYFCSNRSGRFQLYRVKADYHQDLATVLQKEGKAEAELVRELSGDGNDKCPYIINNLMVFTSDRSGGQGGFDLYFSKYGNGSWSPPVNMGDKINSPKDEYRPIVNDFYIGRGGGLNDLLIFSSNREGGKGGFDLYQAGTDIFRK